MWVVACVNAGLWQTEGDTQAGELVACAAAVSGQPAHHCPLVPLQDLHPDALHHLSSCGLFQAQILRVSFVSWG